MSTFSYLPTYILITTKSKLFSLSDWLLQGLRWRKTVNKPFLFLTVRSAPWAARKQAMEAEDFLSWACASPPSSEASRASCSRRNCCSVWWRSASCNGVSPSCHKIIMNSSLSFVLNRDCPERIHLQKNNSCPFFSMMYPYFGYNTYVGRWVSYVV